MKQISIMSTPLIVAWACERSQKVSTPLIRQNPPKSGKFYKEQKCLFPAQCTKVFFTGNSQTNQNSSNLFALNNSLFFVFLHHYLLKPFCNFSLHGYVQLLTLGTNCACYESCRPFNRHECAFKGTFS